MKQRRQGVMLVFGAVLALATASSAQIPGRGQWKPARESGAFITTLGSDTVALERFTIRGNTLDAEAVTRSPRTAIQKIHIEWSDDGEVTSFSSWVRGPHDRADTARSTETVTVQGDSATWTATGRGQPRTWRTPAQKPRAVFAPPLMSPYVMLARIALAKNDSVARVLTSFGRFRFTVTRPAPAWLALADADLGTIRMRLDALWRTFEIDATGSRLGYRTKRVTTMDVQGWASAFARRDSAGRGLGNLSPSDSALAAFGGANVKVVYSRPSRRGRTIFGQVVPWNEPWRTGANAATMFTTDRDLMVATTRVPAGSYTLWTIPSPSGWQLVINKQTGQWGTEYHAEQDLARIPMTVELLPTPVEQFTIAGDGANGRLVMSWDGTLVWVPVRPAP